MSECPAGIVGGECDERPSGACDADGPDLCMAYWRWAARKQRARAEALVRAGDSMAKHLRRSGSWDEVEAALAAWREVKDA